MKTWMPLFLLLVVPGAAWGGGFAIPEQSARAVGTAGTGVASSRGAANVYYDPGYIAFEEGISVELSSTLIKPSVSYRPPDDPDAPRTFVQDALFVVPTVFATLPVSKRVSVGLGAFSNFGLGLQWPSEFDGRFDTLSSNLTTFTLNPTVAVKLNDHFGLGAGADLVLGSVTLTQALNFVDTEGLLDMSASTWGLGFNVGLGSQFLEGDLKVGLHWRSSVPLTFRGHANFTAPIEFQLTTQEVTTQITLPHILFLGVSYRVLDRLRLNLDGNYTTWSSFKALKVSFTDESLNRTLPRNWHDTLTVRLGAEYDVLEALTVRSGVTYDPTPSPTDTLSASLPDGNRLVGALGLGYRSGRYAADLGYMFVHMRETRTSGFAFPARYQGAAHLLALTLGARL